MGEKYEKKIIKCCRNLLPLLAKVGNEGDIRYLEHLINLLKESKMDRSIFDMALKTLVTELKYYRSFDFQMHGIERDSWQDILTDIENLVSKAATPKTANV